MKKSIIKNILKVLFLTILLYLIYSKIDFKKSYDILKKANINYFFLSALLYLISIFFAAIQWNSLLKTQKIKLRYLTALRYTFAGIFFNTFLPSSIGGDAYKIYALGKDKSKWGAAIAGTFLDRVLGFIVLGIFSVITALMLYHKIDIKLSVMIFLFFFAIILGFFIFIYSKSFFLFAKKILLRFFPLKLIITLERFRLNIILLMKNQKTMFRLILLSVIIQGLRVLSNYYAALSIGVNIDLIYYFLFIPIIGFAIALPISFGGVGVRELVSVQLFNQIGVLPEQAVLMQLLAFLASIAINMIGIIFVIKPKRGG